MDHDQRQAYFARADATAARKQADEALRPCCRYAALLEVEAVRLEAVADKLERKLLVAADE